MKLIPSVARLLSRWRMSGDMDKRRLQAVRHATERLGDREEALSFLHRPHGALGGQRPIDIAASSELGMLAVISLLPAD